MKEAPQTNAEVLAANTDAHELGLYDTTVEIYNAQARSDRDIIVSFLVAAARGRHEAFNDDFVAVLKSVNPNIDDDFAAYVERRLDSFTISGHKTRAFAVLKNALTHSV